MLNRRPEPWRRQIVYQQAEMSVRRLNALMTSRGQRLEPWRETVAPAVGVAEEFDFFQIPSPRDVPPRRGGCNVKSPASG